MNKDICFHCGKQKVPQCHNTTISTRSAVHTACPKYLEYQRELWNKKRKSKFTKPLEWTDLGFNGGWASKNGCKPRPLVSNGAGSVIVQLPNGSLAEWEKNGAKFHLQITVLGDPTKPNVIVEKEKDEYEERRLVADHNRRVQRQRRGVDVG